MNLICPDLFNTKLPPPCPFPGCVNCCSGPTSGRIIRYGYFRRSSDSRSVPRFRCLGCKRTFSRATVSLEFRQKKRRINFELSVLLGSQVTQRRAALILGVNRKTVDRRVPLLGLKCRAELEKDLESTPPAHEIQFDELETIEHTKLKPVSVPLAVDAKTRKILGFQVCQMPAKGLLAARSRHKYGPRADHRPAALNSLILNLKPWVMDATVFRSDSNPNYPALLKKHFPHQEHLQEISRRGSNVGQGEIKKGGFDPLFTLNHSCAMLRANVSRLARKTWSTTKRIARLSDHIAIFVWYFNTIYLPYQQRQGPVFRGTANSPQLEPRS